MEIKKKRMRLSHSRRASMPPSTPRQARAYFRLWPRALLVPLESKRSQFAPLPQNLNGDIGNEDGIPRDGEIGDPVNDVGKHHVGPPRLSLLTGCGAS